MKAESRWETHGAVGSSHSTLIKLEFSQDATSPKTPSKPAVSQPTPSPETAPGELQRYLEHRRTPGSEGLYLPPTHPLPDVPGPRWLSRRWPRPRPRLRAGGSQANGEWLRTWKTLLLKRLSHVSADHVFSLSTLWVQIPLYNRSQTEKALCIK